MGLVIKCRLLHVWLLAICFQSSSSNIEIVKDEAMLGWFHAAQGLEGEGELWTGDRTSTNFSETCGTGQSSDYWFISKHINFPNLVPELVFVDIEAEFSPCFGSDGELDCFSDYFQVYVYRGQMPLNIPDVQKSQIKDYLQSHFSHVYNITNSVMQTTVNTRGNHKFSFLQNKSEGVTFGIRSRGACGKIYQMKMYYYYCKEQFLNSIKFAQTVSPPSGSKRVQGNCSSNTSPSKYEIGVGGFCYENGSWSISGKIECSCIPGFEPDPKDGCRRCNIGHYKRNASNSKCKKCPLNSLSIRNETTCKCKNGYYKLHKYSRLSPCYGLLTLDERPKINTSNSGNITITWTKPRTDTGLHETVRYDIECYSCENNVCSQQCIGPIYHPSQHNLTQTSVVVSSLKPGFNYVFRVYPKNSVNEQVDREKWNFTAMKYFAVKTTEKLTSSEQDVSPMIILGVACSLVPFLIIFLVVLILRKKRNARKASITDIGNNGVELLSSHQKMYIDPWNYERPEDAVCEFASELDPTTVFLESMIGGGEFGDVYKGSIKRRDGSAIPVAVKTLKPDASPKSGTDFLLEASVMGQFDNPNVIQLKGVVTKSCPRMIVTEFMSNGSLENFLKTNDCMLSQLQLIGMARGVAAGMKYLARMNFVHRDLAARNVLVNDSLFCKVADFGLSRGLKANETSRGEYSTSGGKIPIRWTAPEAIKYRKFSSASDVWSFGILLWEIMSFAKRPYWDWDNFQVIEELDKGFRLPAPLKCPKGIYDLMLLCWKKNRGERPNFLDITRVTDEWIRSPETVDELVDFSSSLAEWLQSIKMKRYASEFSAGGYENPSQLFTLRDVDLKGMGITLIGHRNKILKGIRALQTEVSGERMEREDSMDV